MCAESTPGIQCAALSVGLTPHAVARIARLRRVLAAVDVFGEVSWTRIAAESGWFDKGRFIRVF